MGSVAETTTPTIEKKKSKGESTLVRVLKYSGFRLFSLFVTVVIGIYLTILIANMGGYVDKMMVSEIQERVPCRLAWTPKIRPWTQRSRTI